MNDQVEDQKVISTEAQQRSKHHKSNATDNPTRNQHRSSRLVERQSEPIKQSDQDINMFISFDATYDIGQGTNDKSTYQDDQDTDTYTNVDAEYTSEQSTADRRDRQLQGHSTQGNEGVTFHTDEDQKHAMEEDHDQDQGEDHCTSMVYSNGQSTNTLNRKQRKNLRKKIKNRTKQKENKFYKKLEERKMFSDS
jgi:hypothetical protein